MTRYEDRTWLSIAIGVAVGVIAIVMIELLNPFLHRWDMLCVVSVLMMIVLLVSILNNFGFIRLRSKIISEEGDGVPVTIRCCRYETARGVHFETEDGVKAVIRRGDEVTLRMTPGHHTARIYQHLNSILVEDIDIKGGESFFVRTVETDGKVYHLGMEPSGSDDQEKEEMTKEVRVQFRDQTIFSCIAAIVITVLAFIRAII